MILETFSLDQIVWFMQLCTECWHLLHSACSPWQKLRDSSACCNCTKAHGLYLQKH